MKLKKIVITLCAILANTTIILSQAPSAQKYIDPVSLSSFYVVAKHFGVELWAGTGFVIHINSKAYLITNDHIVGGKYEKDEYLKLNRHKLPKDSIPDELQVRLYGKQIGSFIYASLPLTAFGNKNKNSWIKFYESESDTSTLLDIAAIPIPDKYAASFQYSGYFDSSILSNNLSLYPSENLFVVGYPEGFAGMVYPIWKRGTIASDPGFFDIGGSSTFLIDATTRKGMSGSPVLFRGSSFKAKNGNDFVTTGYLTYLVGIYSAQSYTSEIGVVTRLDKVFTKLLQQNP